MDRKRKRMVIGVWVVCVLVGVLAGAYMTQTDATEPETITYYQLIKEDDRASLEDAVNNAMANKWKPMGAPFYTQDENGYSNWFQAMVWAYDPSIVEYQYIPVLKQ